ncbi:uncharacterized protein LOC116142824 [Pistacia vera]|uniref:uncharacterized protein LOC116142824 n=1 Tax=Pistacia vera TaxID=55513 RepID=UPI001263D743|nr:uncharacterized protein LOC116142824 [Pistacia vera]
MPSYAKFLKEILANKRKLEDEETLILTEECNAILQKKQPLKLKDPRSFSIPYVIGNIAFDRVLRLGIGEVKPTTVSLQLVDRSIKHPRGIVEDVLVKVDKVIFSADFVVLDMEEDKEIPFILGRSFLATGKALIDVQEGKLILRVQDGTVTFNVFEVMKFPSESDSCFSVDLVDRLVADTIKENTPHLPLEVCIAQSKTINVEEPKKNECGYNQIAIAPEDQEKMTFTCPYGTFAY